MKTSEHANNATTSETQFFAALMEHVMQGIMIPKMQVERAVGPIIGFFLADALSISLNQDVVMLCPEFPIRKNDVNQSTNIDWLMYSRHTQELLLVELKTTDTTFRSDQADIYRNLQKAIAARSSAAFLVDDVHKISDASQERGKYQNVLKLLAHKLKNEQDASEDSLRQALDRCKSARVIYLAPEACKRTDWPVEDTSWTWMSFKDLPVSLNEHAHADHWPAVRSSLVSLDALTRRIRNGDPLSGAGDKNYCDVLCFEKLLKRCQSEGEKWVIGFMNWGAELPTLPLGSLRTRSYKCDHIEGGRGKKIAKNWIRGDQFLALVSQRLNTSALPL